MDPELKGSGDLVSSSTENSRVSSDIMNSQAKQKINVKTKVSHKIHTETVLGNFGDYMASFVCNCGDCSSFLGLTADHKGCNSEDHRLNITSHFTTMCD